MSPTYHVHFEHQEYLIINKGIGLAVQSKEDTDLLRILERQYNKKLHLITRLDQPVSGLVLIAKNKSIAAHFSGLMSEGRINKKYTAIVEGKLSRAEGSIISNLTKKHTKNFIDEHGKKSVLDYKVIKELDRYTVLEITTDTGRFHQIRAQLQSIGHPIKGDLKYGAKRSNKEGGIYLHCGYLEIYGKELSSWNVSPPENMSLYFA
jgi:23S rRNA pseudouridine1911/1915/1917 synthase